jgi:hypothetical protein
MVTPAAVPLEPLWSVVANVRPEAFGRATSPGTRHFVAGAKIFCVNWMWGMGFDTVVAIGRQRGSMQLIELLMRTAFLTNFRAKLVYKPAVLRKLRRSPHFEVRSQEWCVEASANLNKWLTPTENLADRKDAFARALRLMRDDARGIALRDRALEVLEGKTSDDAMTVFVLCDFLEEHGIALSYDDVVTTLRRQRDNP